ncbi:MAG TPA: glycoside hydrolase family 16 protein [Spirillospora sp.]
MTVTTVTVGVLGYAALNERTSSLGPTDPTSGVRELSPTTATLRQVPGGVEDVQREQGPGLAEDAGAPADTGGTGGAADGSGSGVATAAKRYGWGTPVASDEFDGPLDRKAWEVYDGEGHAGNGRRSPDQVKVVNGVLRITGRPDGTTGGLGWRAGAQKMGRWEARVRLNRACACYNANILLWPEGGGGGVAPEDGGGEIDYMETYGDDGRRRGANFFLHFDQKKGQEQPGRENNSGRLDGHVEVDLTRWHTFAVEWTAKGITGYVDGRRWFHTSRKDVLPPRAMGQAIQLDWMPELKEKTAPSVSRTKNATLEVDWIRMYRP